MFCVIVPYIFASSLPVIKEMTLLDFVSDPIKIMSIDLDQHCLIEKITIPFTVELSVWIVPGGCGCSIFMGVVQTG